MKVILSEDVDNLGDMGETVNVAPGYARNFLLPRRLAVQADSASAKQIEHEMRIIRKRDEKRRVELAEVAKGLGGIRLEFTAKAGTEGKLFGSITSLHISNKLQEIGHPVNRRKIQLAEPIKSLGEHEVEVVLTSGIGATLKVIVQAEEPDPSEIEGKEEASVQPTDEALPDTAEESSEAKDETPVETAEEEVAAPAPEETGEEPA